MSQSFAADLWADAKYTRWLRDLFTRDGKLSPEGWVVARLTHPDGSIDLLEGHNLVTDAGDLWYAQKLGLNADAVTNDFAGGKMVLGTGATAPAKGSTYSNITPIAGASVAQSSGYPKRNDADTDNTGKAVDSITWKGEYTAASFNQASGITEGVLTVAAPAAGSPLLAFWDFAASFGKDSSTQLTVWVNHNFLGS